MGTKAGLDALVEELRVEECSKKEEHRLYHIVGAFCPCWSSDGSLESSKR